MPQLSDTTYQQLLAEYLDRESERAIAADQRTAYRALRRIYNHDEYKSPEQEAAVRAAIAGRDVFALLPTGSGKSVCYQLPALTRPGMAVIVSPLIALMSDQVQALQANGVAAELYNSNLSAQQKRDARGRMLDGEIDLLYMHPKTAVEYDWFVRFLRNVEVGLFGVDEAHVVSTWGNQFVPAYRRLDKLRECFPRVPIVATTASATRQAQDDIINVLGLRDPLRVEASLFRPSIHLRVEMKESDPTTQLLNYIRSRGTDKGIVFAHKKRTVDRLTRLIDAQGISAVAYHAGREDREEAASSFSLGDAQVLVGTIAFGMGIDISDTRWVVHYDLPDRLESYYQEVGRASRDGSPAQALLLYDEHDYLYKMGLRDSRGDLLSKVRAYALDTECRWRHLLSYFSQDLSAGCGACDNCERSALQDRAVSKLSTGEERRETVSVGSRVTVILLNTSETLAYEIVPCGEEDFRKKRLSTTSPLGRALMGKRRGDMALVGKGRATARYVVQEVS